MVPSRCLWLINLICAMVQFTVATPACAAVKDTVSNILRPEDIAMLDTLANNNSTVVAPKNSTSPVIDCLGLGIAGTIINKFLDMKPDISATTQFYFYSRSNISGVQNDVNVLAVDWSAGANAFRYPKAVANTRKVGEDVYQFINNLMKQTGKPFQKMHMIGHSLGAHIVGYASKKLKNVYRITGLDPALPCFETNNIDGRLDRSDAEFVDIIHTNGREWYKGFGLPTPIGHADFYPNGGMTQPGCEEDHSFLRKCYNYLTVAVVETAICSHSRSQELFTETLSSKNCVFNGYEWDLTYDGVNSSLKLKPSTVMGLKADADKGRAAGTFLVVTNDKEPYCGKQQAYLPDYLLKSLRNGLNIKGDKATKNATGPVQNSLFKPFIAIKNLIG